MQQELMKKYIITAFFLVALVVLGSTIGWWIPRLSEYLGEVKNEHDTLRGLAALGQLILWGGAGLLTAIQTIWYALVKRVRREGRNQHQGGELYAAER